ncbi:Enoyl-CoA hydratase [Paraburkholderia xenovorans LB400]|uniref:Enoyl-CoA hydratase n=2 Tax=Paraburkholderia xenovorans TaxID=36873 RepID=Q13GS3_PARXL|nr:Enoyl-CoA hydratase [Paraburkholderia xenovorans LB400]
MRPHKRNALTLEMFSALADRLEAAQDDVSVRVVVLCGAGGHYTAGHDLEDFTRWPQHPGDPVPRALHALASLSKPVVIAVHGVAMGFGATSLLHADWSVGSADARLRLPFVELGIGPEAGSSLLLASAVGGGRARGWLMRGHEFSGADAHAAGLIHELAPTAEVQARALARADELAAQDALALRDMKRLMRPASAVLHAAIDEEIAAINASLARRPVRFR